jgi:hypothetical protein
MQESSRGGSKFFLKFGDLRSQQVPLEGGDASSDSCCYP